MKRTWQYLLAVFFAAGLIFLSACGGGSTYDRTLMKVASDLNETCPMMVDSETRLDNAVALPDNFFQYNYTMVNYARADLDIDVLTRTLTEQITAMVRTSPDLQNFRDNHVTMIYAYKDMNGEHITKVTVTPEANN